MNEKKPKHEPAHTRKHKKKLQTQWTEEDDNKITSPDRPPDKALSREIGRSLMAINVRRTKLLKIKE